MDARARILARRAAFLSATLAACAPAPPPASSPAPAPTGTPEEKLPVSKAPKARPDADGDGIPDDEDACPNQKGSAKAWDPKTHGCPSLSIVTVSKIVIVEKVYFGDQSAVVQAEAVPILETIKGALVANPQLTYVKIVGHRDAKEPKPLAAQRAEAVRKWLVDHGVEASRLEGLDAGTTGAAPDPAKNRRVEFEVP